MELSPLSGQENTMSPSFGVKPIGFPTKLGSLFKNCVFDSLNKKGKQVFLKFEIFTKASLIEALRDGCRILRLNCQVVYSDEDCIVVEDHIGRAERISYSQLKEIFSNTKAAGTNISPVGNSKALQQDRPFDLLILANKNDKKTANFFAKELMIPHIITFIFKNKEKDFKHKLYEDECIDWFSQNFYEEIVDGATIKDAFNTAYTKTFDYLSASFFESKDNQYIIDLIGVGPVLLPEDQDHTVKLYDTSQYMLPEGRVEDVSKARCPTNVQKLITPFVGRNNDIDAMAQILVKEECNFVKLCGEPGVGKTSFSLQLAYFFLTHGLFPNGIFYFNLKNILGSNKELTDVMKETFGSKFENNIKNFFRGKKMLLIFDDFDLFYHKNLRFPRLVFCTLKECKIATIVVTNLQNMTPTLKKGRRQGHDQEQKRFEAEFIKKEHRLSTLSRDEMAHLLLSLANADLAANCPFEMIRELSALKKMGGNPSALIEKLLDNEIVINKRRIEVNPYYTAHLNIDDVVETQNSLQRLPRSVLNLSMHSTNAAFESTRTKASTMKMIPISALKELYNEHGRRKTSKHSLNKFEETYTPKQRKKGGLLTSLPKKGSLRNIFMSNELGHEDIIEEGEDGKGFSVTRAVKKTLSLALGGMFEQKGRKKSGDHLLHPAELQINLKEPPLDRSIAARISQKFGPSIADLIVESPEASPEKKNYGAQEEFTGQLIKSYKNFEEDFDNEEEDAMEDIKKNDHRRRSNRKSGHLAFPFTEDERNSHPIKESYVSSDSDEEADEEGEEEEEEEKVHAEPLDHYKINKVIESLLPENDELDNEDGAIDYGVNKQGTAEQLKLNGKGGPAIYLQHKDNLDDDQPEQPDDGNDEKTPVIGEAEKSNEDEGKHEDDEFRGDD
mgnify:CR=1 FL=1